MASLNSYRDGPMRYWQLMQALNKHFGCFTVPALVDLVDGKHRSAIRTYVRYLMSVRIIRGDDNSLMILREGDAPPMPRVPAETSAMHQALWVAMRGLQTFSVAELSYAATTEDRRIPYDSTRLYINALKTARYLMAMGPDRYRLMPARNTGPMAPVPLSERRGIYDLNVMRTVNVTIQPVVNEKSRRAA